MWLILITNLPGRNQTPRMRVWRALKACGAGILRDGVYLLPATEATRDAFEQQITTVENAGGTAWLLENEYRDEQQFRDLFDRHEQYSEWADKAATIKTDLQNLSEPEARRHEARIRREYEAIVRMDYFPGEAKARAGEALAQIDEAINRLFSPDEPTAAEGMIGRETLSEFHNRLWATRKNLWVDRVASAWLIHRHIDPKATFLWLEKPADCPAEAAGFDFDGATFSHVGDFVTFEVLLHAFDLAGDAALARIGELVHYLDVGGVPVAEAAGFVTMLAGAKQQCTNDDDLLDTIGTTLDYLYLAFNTATTGDE